MNIAIIGCGYVGTAVARHWHQDNDRVITATTTTNSRVQAIEAVAQRVVVMKGDDSAALRSVVQNQDAILLSISPGSRQVDANVYAETYLLTAQNLVPVLQQTPSVKQLIYTSTYSVCGNANGAWVDEDTPVAPVNRRGEILRETEQVLLEASSENLRVCILRLGGIYGFDRELVKIFSRFAGKTRPGNGEEFTNWIHLDDIVSAVDFALSHRLQGIYNLVNDVPVISRELIERVCERHNLSPVLWDALVPKSDPFSVRVSNQKIKAAGYKLIHPEIVV